MDSFFLIVWLQTAVSWILVQFHQLFSTFMDPAGGWTWTLSIVGLVIVIRILLIPLFVKQIKSQRNLQLIQPQILRFSDHFQRDLLIYILNDEDLVVVAIQHTLHHKVIRLDDLILFHIRYDHIEEGLSVPKGLPLAHPADLFQVSHGSRIHGSHIFQR